MLPFNSNKKLYRESSGTMTFDFESPWKVKFRITKISVLYSRKGAELGHMLLLNIQVKATYVKSMEVFSVLIYQLIQTMCMT